MQKPTPYYNISPEYIDSIGINEIFVFGSNIEGIHGSGAAETALKWGAKMGKGVGHHGNTYAIPTMFQSVEKIVPYVDDFIHYAVTHPELKFLVTEIGCGIAGFSVNQIAPLFERVVSEGINNVHLPKRFLQCLLRK